MSTIWFLPITYYNYKGRERVVETGNSKKEMRYHIIERGRGKQTRYESEDKDGWAINFGANRKRDNRETRTVYVGDAG